MNLENSKSTDQSIIETNVSGGSSNQSAPKKPPSLVLPTISCPLICEQGPSMPSSPTVNIPNGLITADLMTRIQMFSSQFDGARLSPNYATSDLGSSARSSFSTASSWMAYRDRSVDFDEAGKELISPFDCDTACSVSPSFSLSPNSFNHFSFDARSVSSLCYSSNNLNQLLTVGELELSRIRSRSESDMTPIEDDNSTISHSSVSVPCYGKKSLMHKYNQEIKRSNSTPPPTTSERDEIEIEERRASSRLETKEDIEAANLLVSNWARDQLCALQTAKMYNDVVSNFLAIKSEIKPEPASPTNSLPQISPNQPIKLVPKIKKGDFSLRDETSRAQQMQYTCSLCGQAFAVHDRLAKHIASRHRQRSCTLDDASKVHKCGMCSKSFSRSDMLTRHMRLHTGAKPYSCPICSQVFSRSDHLSTHLRTHTGEKPYACPLCSYSASRRDMISRHMRTHAMSENSSSLDVSNPISHLSIRSATTSPLPPKPGVVEIRSGGLSAFKPITSLSSNHLSVVSTPLQSLSISTPSSPTNKTNIRKSSSKNSSTSS